MAILAECDICGHQHRVKDGLVGASIRCKECEVLFTVPQGPSISPETYLDQGGRLRLREREAEASRLWPRFVAGLVAVLAIAALAGAVWAFTALVRPEKTSSLTLRVTFGAVWAFTALVRPEKTGELDSR